MKWFLIVLIILAIVILLGWWWRSRSIMTASTPPGRTSDASGLGSADVGATSAPAAVAAAGTAGLVVDGSSTTTPDDDDTATDDAGLDPNATVDDAGELSHDLDVESEWADDAGSTADIDSAESATTSHEISPDAGGSTFDSPSDSGGAGGGGDAST